MCLCLKSASELGGYLEWKRLNTEYIVFDRRLYIMTVEDYIFRGLSNWGASQNLYGAFWSRRLYIMPQNMEHAQNLSVSPELTWPFLPRIAQ